MDDLGDSAILKKVEKYRRDFSRWNWNVFRNVRKELEKKKKILLIQVEREALISGLNCKIRELKSEVNFFLNKEARLWSQRSVFWLKNGDNNTKFFHNKATKRHRKKFYQRYF